MKKRNYRLARVQKLCGQEVYLPDDVYALIQRDMWAEEKEKYRKWRCRDGKGVMCKKDCTQCDYYRAGHNPRGSDVSLEDYLSVDDGENESYSIDIEDTNYDLEEIVANNTLKNAYEEAKKEMSKRDAKMVDLLLMDLSISEMGKELGVSKSTAWKIKERVMAKLQVSLKNFQDFLK